jgi:hypothetical protein
VFFHHFSILPFADFYQIFNFVRPQDMGWKALAPRFALKSNFSQNESVFVTNQP